MNGPANIVPGPHYGVEWDQIYGFEYRVCQTQFGRVTFVNGAWQGHTPLGSGDSQEALDSCPQLWEYLSRAGASGWELVAATNTNVTEIEGGSQLTSQLFLKRQRL